MPDAATVWFCVLDLKPGSSVEIPGTPAEVLWNELTAELKRHRTADQKFFWGRQIEDESKLFLVGSELIFSQAAANAALR
jgi:hypothetical protein